LKCEFKKRVGKSTRKKNKKERERGSGGGGGGEERDIYLIKTMGLLSLNDDIKTELCNATVRKHTEPRLTEVPKSTSGAPS